MTGALMIAAAFAAVLGMCMYLGATLRASSERVQALKAQVDSQDDEMNWLTFVTRLSIFASALWTQKAR